jgi:hypothetical protein
MTIPNWAGLTSKASEGCEFRTGYWLRFEASRKSCKVGDTQYLWSKDTPHTFIFAPSCQSSSMTMMMNVLTTLTVLLSLAASSRAVELTKDTWDDAVAGKAVFAKFLYVYALLEPIRIRHVFFLLRAHTPCLLTEHAASWRYHGPNERKEGEVFVGQRSFREDLYSRPCLDWPTSVIGP